MGKPSSYTRFQDPEPSTRASLLLPPLRRGPVATPKDRVAGTLFSLPKEPEDARLTGGTRSLDRRLLALNVAGSLAKRRPMSERGGSSYRPAVA